MKLTGDERKEAEKRDEEARVWISGLEAVKRKIGVRAVYDLSATPFFLRGSGYPEGTLFPWVVSDFSLIDAIECGIVKVPRVPVADNSMTGDQPTYRDLWLRIRDAPAQEGPQDRRRWPASRCCRRARGRAAEPVRQLREVLQALAEQRRSKPARRYAAGVHRGLQQHQRLQAGLSTTSPDGRRRSTTEPRCSCRASSPLFSNVDGRRLAARPNTILVDSEQLESGEAMSDEFKKIAAREIEEFKAEYRRGSPGATSDKLTDEDLLREVMNTVGKPGKLGEQIKCVVSRLDAHRRMGRQHGHAHPRRPRLRHAAPVRAGGGPRPAADRATRSDSDGLFEPEYAEVYGVPFSFIPTSGSAKPTPTEACDPGSGT